MPGTCVTSNSNCKRIGGNAFRCVCKEQYMAINKTHCGLLKKAKINNCENIFLYIISSSDQCID
jgi:hypothetical protein